MTNPEMVTPHKFLTATGEAHFARMTALGHVLGLQRNEVAAQYKKFKRGGELSPKASRLPEMCIGMSLYGTEGLKVRNLQVANIFKGNLILFCCLVDSPDPPQLHMQTVIGTATSFKMKVDTTDALQHEEVTWADSPEMIDRIKEYSLRCDTLLSYSRPEAEELLLDYAGQTEFEL